MILSVLLVSSTLIGCQSQSEFDRESTKMEGEIVISVYKEEEWMTMAVQLFEDKYPDVTVKVEAFYQGEDEMIVTSSGGVELIAKTEGKTKEDYALWLNTNLMSGTAGDIVITSDGILIDNYINMGVFEDLTPYLEATSEINDEHHYMNLFEAYKTESGALYQFPVSAMAQPIFLFDNEMVEEAGLLEEFERDSITWREALTLGQEIYDASTSKKELPSSRTLLNDVFVKEVVASIDYENEQVVLREEELREVLNAYEEFEYYPSSDGGENVFRLTYGMDVQMASSVLSGQYIPLQWEQSDGTVQMSSYYSIAFGINSQSNVKNMAWEFLAFLVSDEVQTLPSFQSSGINREGVEVRGKLNVLEEDVEESINMVNGWLEKVNSFRAEDTDLINICYAILGEYESGMLTEDEAIEKVKFQLTQYMSE